MSRPQFGLIADVFGNVGVRVLPPLGLLYELRFQARDPLVDVCDGICPGQHGQHGDRRVEHGGVMGAPQTVADQFDYLVTSPSCHAVQNALRPGVARLGVFGEEAISRRLLQRVINRAGLDLGPNLRTPALQLGPHLVAMRAAGEVHDTEYQELRRRHAPTSAQSARTRSACASVWCQLPPTLGCPPGPGGVSTDLQTVLVERRPPKPRRGSQVADPNPRPRGMRACQSTSAPRTNGTSQDLSCNAAQ